MVKFTYIPSSLLFLNPPTTFPPCSYPVFYLKKKPTDSLGLPVHDECRTMYGSVSRISDPHPLKRDVSTFLHTHQMPIAPHLHVGHHKPPPTHVGILVGVMSYKFPGCMPPPVSSSVQEPCLLQQTLILQISTTSGSDILSFYTRINS